MYKYIYISTFIDIFFKYEKIIIINFTAFVYFVTGGETHKRFQYLPHQRWSHLYGWCNIEECRILGTSNTRSYKVTHAIKLLSITIISEIV